MGSRSEAKFGDSGEEGRNAKLQNKCDDGGVDITGGEREAT
jgi:hypothetical protein